MPSELNDTLEESVYLLLQKVKAQHALLYLIAKANGGSVVIPTYYTQTYGDRIGSLVFEETELGATRIVAKSQSQTD